MLAHPQHLFLDVRQSNFLKDVFRKEDIAVKKGTSRRAPGVRAVLCDGIHLRPVLIYWYLCRLMMI